MKISNYRFWLFFDKKISESKCFIGVADKGVQFLISNIMKISVLDNTYNYVYCLSIHI